MIAVITLVELKSPFKFFALSYHALKIVKQLKTTKYKAYKNTGFWTTHYTMTLWENRNDMLAFARSGAHLETMKITGTIAKEIRTLEIETSVLPDWKEAKKSLKEEGKSLKF